MSKNEIASNQSENIIYKCNTPIFKFLAPNGNDKLSEMKGYDLQDLLLLIDNYYLELRKSLGFDNYVTFGLELEFEEAMKERIDSQLIQAFPKGTWKTKCEDSLKNGAEISSPIMRDNPNDWGELKTVCSIVSHNAIIGLSSAGHIHVGTQVLGNKCESWLNFLKLWSVYENIIYRFVYNDFLTARPRIFKYAEPMAQTFWEDYVSLKQGEVSISKIMLKISHKRNQAVNFNNISSCKNFYENNTIEFRCPNGTLEPAIWQNNVNLFVHLLIYSKELKFDDDIIQKRKMINYDKYAELDWYGEIYLQQALELSDMIFTNNFDKVYFLRQYLKSFEKGTKILEKTTPFYSKSVF